MVRYTGRLSFLQYIRNKPNQLGIKVFILADGKTGYVHSWKVYTGRENQRNRSHVYNIIVELTTDLTYRDTLFAYLDIIKFLARKDIGCVGTVSKRRTFLPAQIKNLSRSIETGQVIFRRASNIMVLAYKDRNIVRLISNVHGRELVEGGRPVSIRDYNIYARGVDLSNQLVSSYPNNHKSKKWYKTLYLSFLETSVANAYILYKFRNPLASIKNLSFRENLVVGLLQEYIDQLHIERLAQPNNRLVIGMHRIGIREQRNCFVCSTKNKRVTTKYYCIECNQNVCASDCFYKLHTLLVVYTRNKERNL